MWSWRREKLANASVHSWRWGQSLIHSNASFQASHEAAYVLREAYVWTHCFGNIRTYGNFQKKIKMKLIYWINFFFFCLRYDNVNERKANQETPKGTFINNPGWILKVYGAATAAPSTHKYNLRVYLSSEWHLLPCSLPLKAWCLLI